MRLTELFCSVDEFCQVFLPEWKKHQLGSGEKKRCRKTRLTVSEIMTIVVFFQESKFRDFKAYYLNYVSKELRTAFPKLLSYTRFVSLIKSIFIPLCAYLQSRKKDSNGISFVDSTTIVVCHNKRIYNHKVFEGLAARGKSTMGWFFGFKLHLICDHQGELINCAITPGNTDDRKPIPTLTKKVKGKLFGDKGYISQELFESLFQAGLQLITGIKKKMKNKLMPLFDKILLRKRGMIESINNQLKHVFHLVHTRHRNPLNGFINMIAAVVAYTHHPRKPSIGLSENTFTKLVAS